MANTVSEFCRGVILGGTLEDKLARPRKENGDALEFDDAQPVVFDAPVRAPRLEMTAGQDKLPKLTALREQSARARCLERFCGHELQAVELFAWALLAFPHVPLALRRALLVTLAEEQLHLQLYLDRLRAHNGALGDTPLSGYFWNTVPGCWEKDDPVTSFLCGMGLTLEQANLDFTLLYRDAFADAGDVETAAVIQRVHDDELRHVRLAAQWTRRLADIEAHEEVAVYDAAVPFPLAAARAKGRKFSRDARVAAGLSPAFIDHVEQAQPYRAKRTSAEPGDDGSAPHSPASES